MKVIFAAVSITLLINVILGYPRGAPNQACNSISPDPKRHGAPPQRSRSPFTLTIRGNPTEYIPGQQYTLILSTRKRKRRFRGFLVVSQNSNKDRVGLFTAGKGQRLTCNDHLGITHKNRLKKKSVTLTWTAPPEGTGAVVFKYAGVFSRKMYWANQLGPILQEKSVTSTAVEPSSKVPLTSSATSSSKVPLTSSATSSSKVPLTSSALPSSKVPLTSSATSSSKVTLMPSSTSTSIAPSVAVTSSEMGTSTPSPTPSTTISTATGEATSTGPASSISVEASSRETSLVAIVTPSVAPITTPSVAPVATPSVAPIATPSVAPNATPTPSAFTSAPFVTVPETDGNGSPGSSSFAGMVMTLAFLIMGLLAMMI